MKVYKSLHDQQVIKQLLAGAVGVLPSDTVYGVMCDATDPSAVQALYALKHREKKPGTIIAASVDQLVALGLKRRYLTAVETYWPGAVSVVVPTDNPLLTYLDQGKGSLAVRVIADDELVRLLKQTGPLLTSSANMPGEPPATSIIQAQGYFGERVKLYVDGGDLSGRQPSTVIRVVDDAVEVLRPGAVTIHA